MGDLRLEGYCLLPPGALESGDNDAIETAVLLVYRELLGQGRKINWTLSAK
jgi:hypothetical protein